MRRIPVLFMITLLSLSCSKYTIRTEIEKSGEISEIQKAGVIVRISERSKIPLDEHIKSISHWLGGYKQLKDILIYAESNEPIHYYSGDSMRFYQISSEGTFLRYKSLGIVNSYLRANSAELNRFIEEKKLNGLIIYEIYTVLSSEMQFMDFDSVVIITDKNLNVLYMDNQRDGFDSNEYDLDRVKEQLLNRITERFLEILFDNDFIEEFDI
jgi:hypothetical protein